MGVILQRIATDVTCISKLCVLNDIIFIGIE